MESRWSCFPGSRRRPSSRFTSWSLPSCGVWPAWLADHFETVYTFEPDRENFRCLVQNVPDNVVCFQSALGYQRKLIDLHRDPVNCGAYFVEKEGTIPTLRIDDLELPACDLIVLDVEGMEADALQGAMLTGGAPMASAPGGSMPAARESGGH